MEQKEGKSIIGTIIDSPVEDVVELMKQGEFNLTTLKNLKKGLELQYIRVEGVKNQLFSGIEDGKIDKESGINSINDLYKTLQLIEDRATIVQKYIEEKLDLKVLN